MSGFHMAVPELVRFNRGDSDAETKANLKWALDYYLQQVMGRAEFTLLSGEPNFDRFLEDLANEVIDESQRCGKSHLVGNVAALMKFDLGDEQTNRFVCNLVKNIRIETPTHKIRRDKGEEESATAKLVRYMLGKFWL